MKRLPQRTSLAAQTAEVLREVIASGQWPHWLPGELELMQRMHVSRVTLRAALAVLERENLITGGQGKRREVQQPIAGNIKPQLRRTVVLLTPAPLHRLPAATVFWMDELREHLDAAGWPLEIHESAAAYRRRPAHALEELAARLAPAGWVIFRSTPEMQRWFSDKGFPAVIAGSVYPNVPLASVDVDYFAGCRHAAGRMLAAGHQRMAILRPDTSLAGDLESVEGFRAGAKDAQVSEVLHDATTPGVCLRLDQLFAQSPAPTGLLVFHASHLLTVIGWLQRAGRRVPQDVSVLCRDDEPILDAVIPTPSRYTLNPLLFARKISRAVLGLVTGGGNPLRSRLLPTFVRGETLAKAAD
jgi:DNA-binding LacI/PurR family transcriptional regulator